jgi:hypothetical protein
VEKKAYREILSTGVHIVLHAYTIYVHVLYVPDALLLSLYKTYTEVSLNMLHFKLYITFIILERYT